jgi:hypothetical protein
MVFEEEASVRLTSIDESAAAGAGWTAAGWRKGL